MDNTPTSLDALRNARVKPAPELVSKDDHGRSLFTFILSYEMDGNSYGTDLVAYSQEDAEARVTAMRESLRYEGQLFTRIPA